MRGYTSSQEAAKWSLSGARPVLEGLGWSPVTHEGLYIMIQAVSTLLNGTLVVAWGPGVVSSATWGSRYTVQRNMLSGCWLLFNSTTQTSERLLNGLWVVLGVLRMVLSDLRGAIISCSFWLNKHNSKQFFPYELRSNKDERVFRVRLKTWIITDCMHTVHYHAITWCYLCSVNQYASFGTPQAYSGRNKKSAFFAKNSNNARRVR